MTTALGRGGGGACPGDFGKAFNYIRIKDSTQFKVPDNMQEYFKGCGGSAAGMSIQYEYDLKRGKILDFVPAPCTAPVDCY
jgi:hypothetical protein